MPKRWITNLIFEKLPTLQRFYFDTSVFGGVYDIEFDEASVQIFEKVKLGQVVCIYSDLTEENYLMHQNELEIFQRFTQRKFRGC